MAKTKTSSFRLKKAYIKALDELIKERGYENRTKAIEYCIIKSYMQTHNDEDWDKILKDVYHLDKS